MGISKMTAAQRQYASTLIPANPRAPRSRPTTRIPASSRRRRNVHELTCPPGHTLVSGSAAPWKKRAKAKAKTSSDEPPPERRAKRFRTHPPKTYLERAARALSQRMFVVGHTATNVEVAPEMSFDIVGTTGNIYKTVIGKVPTCSCPDARKGNQCKHICYVLVKALKAPHHLQYQLAFLSSELREMYNASPISREQPKATENNDGNRKPVEGDCPICFMEFEPDREETVWCQAACGNNIHKTCFQQWAATQTRQRQEVRCVYCRSPWETKPSNVDLDKLVQEGNVSADGYVNVADQFGLSRMRDYSTYHPYWVHQQSYPYGSHSGRHSYHYGGS
ncbi:RING finger domain protein [Aspergillus heteromorphus CBS 117.55]|uniref:RING finger domain protein n=1 Tax=Aspergillus heteromorphus CBS 117.55 TaxID=1448321 RepID=A0A317WJM9_9EURO|nr:RING finger domain protein [Aspergillus heteromorphus CBS 117.55]PWY86265.1 RING finger domain protein [Aspergillus heteromorphus CBS 117.55]